jgi:cytochrome oxidase Cu insertion factor (SCO1/SenC/PrrC family)
VGAAAVAGIGIGALVVQLTRASAPSVSMSGLGAAAATWPAGVRAAPAFSLRDQNGAPVSLASLGGRTAIVTFLDPLCRSECPLEAKVLNRAIAQMPAATRPAVIAVSVNRWGNAKSNLVADRRHWRLGPEWRWGIGAPAALASVWRKYSIGVEATTKVVAGVKVHNIVHTEAAYVIDGTGHERALFVWPYGSPEVVRTLTSLTPPGSSA